MSLGQTQCAQESISRPIDLSEYYSTQGPWAQGQDQNQTRLRNRNTEGTQVTQKRKEVREMVHSSILWSIYSGQVVYSAPLKNGGQDIYVGSFHRQRRWQRPQSHLFSSLSLGLKARHLYDPDRWHLVIDVMLMATIEMLVWPFLGL